MDAAQTGSLGFKIESKAGGEATSSLEMPEKELLTRFIVSIQRYLNENDPLFYRKIWDVIRNQFPSVLSTEEIEMIESAIERIEHGPIALTYNEESITARQVFDLISRAGFFEVDEGAQKRYSEMVQVPFTANLLWHIFLSYAFDFHRIIALFFDLILRIEKDAEYGPLLEEKRADQNKCIYCLQESGDFRSEEHVIPESLVGDYAFLPRGFVCDRCNNGVCAGLDQQLQNFEPIAYLRVVFGPF